MIQPNFDLLITNNANATTFSHHPLLKTEYAAGFRKFEPKPKQQPILSSMIKSNAHQQALGKQVLNYVERVGVANLADLYYQSIQSDGKSDLDKIKKQQQESVTRLYKNIYPKRVAKQDQNQSQQIEGKHSAQKQWKLDQKFENEPIQYIIANQLQRTHRKFVIQLNGACKKKRIEPSSDFVVIFSCFILQDNEKINKILSKQKSIQQKDIQLLYLWKSFLSTINLSTIQKKYAQKVISQQNLNTLRNQNRYIYCLTNLVIQSPQINLQGLKKIIKVPQSFQSSAKQIMQKFTTNKEYTNPYQIQFKRIQRAKRKKEVDDKQQQQHQRFKAKLIPKSTYQPPKAEYRPEPKRTQIQPFSLTEEKKPISAEEYYKWDRQFKAQPVPETTYKPKKAILLNEQQKKARALLNLQKASYPGTMLNLNHYNTQKQQKMQQLVLKHQKVRAKISSSQIPNFDHLHAQQLILLEEKKEKNKRKTQIQSFKLSINKPSTFSEQKYFDNPLKIQNQTWKQKPAKNSKSTKKFDASVNYRKRQQEKNAKTIEQKLKQQSEKNEKKKPLVEIIKNRMQDQFNAYRPHRRSSQENIWPQKIKVNEQKIYWQRPLLMQSNKRKQEYELPWDPIF